MTRTKVQLALQELKCQLAQKPTPPSKKIWVQTRRLVTSFDASTRFVTCTGTDKFPHTATCVCFFFRKSSKAARR